MTKNRRSVVGDRKNVLYMAQMVARKGPVAIPCAVIADPK
jgi:hypothetical protein